MLNSGLKVQLITLKVKTAPQIVYDLTLINTVFKFSNPKPKWSHYNIRGIKSMACVSGNIPIIEFEDFGKTLNALKGRLQVPKAIEFTISINKKFAIGKGTSRRSRITLSIYDERCKVRFSCLQR